MLAVLAEQGDTTIDALVQEMNTVARAHLDDEGRAFPMATHIVTALR
jgi:hypothetical protein